MTLVNRNARLARQHVPLAGLTAPVRLPVYVSLCLLITAVMGVIVVGWTTLLRQGTQPANPFSDYEAVSPGQPGSALDRLRFSCAPGYTSPYDHLYYCTRAPASVPFSLVTVTISDGMVSRTHFAIHADTLTIGDLALLWGRPRIRLYRQSAIFEWPSPGIRAEGWVESGRFSFAIPVLRLSFGNPEIADT